MCFTACILVQTYAVEGQEQTARTARACDGVNEWAPFSYFERVDGRKTDRVVGASLDLVREILGMHGYGITIDKTVPWLRCLKSVEAGEEYQLVLSAVYTEERNQAFYVSNPYYWLQMGYFYSTSVYPDGLEIKSTAEANRYRICGLLGYNYQYPGLEANKVDQGARTHLLAIEKLQKRRCDLLLEYHEVLAGLKLVGQDLMTDSELEWQPLTDIEPEAYHIMLSKQYPHGEELV